MHLHNIYFFNLDGMEVRKVFLLTGAEKERKSLEKLLHRRAEFTGQPLDNVEVDDTTSFSTSATSVPGKKIKKVIGFGGDATAAYGFGKIFVFYCLFVLLLWSLLSMSLHTKKRFFYFALVMNEELLKIELCD